MAIENGGCEWWLQEERGKEGIGVRGLKLFEVFFLGCSGLLIFLL